MAADAVALRPGAPVGRHACGTGSLLTWEAPRPHGPALLCLHGAACGAWVWAEGFAAALAAAGHPSAALDFSRAPGTSLTGFVQQARGALAALDRPAVLVGHSLGGLVAQLLLTDPRVRGAVLLAPVPPEGLWPTNARLACADPALWQDLSMLSQPDAAAPTRLAAALFGPAIEPERARRHVRRLAGESSAAVLEAQWPQLVSPACLLGKPVLVLGAQLDRLIDAPAVHRCAAWHGTTATLLAERGHLLMLDAGWQAVAARIAGWLGLRFA